MHYSTPTNAVLCVEKISVGGATLTRQELQVPISWRWCALFVLESSQTYCPTPPRKEVGMTLWVSPSKVVSGPVILVLYRHTGDPVSGSCDSYFYNLDILCSTGG